MTDTSHPQGADKTPDIDPLSVEDLAEFKAWKEAQAEYSKADLPSIPNKLELVDPSKPDKVHEFRLAPLDEDVLATLQALATFAETDTERAAAMFQAVLLPGEYERLKAMMPRFIRDVRKRRIADGEAPSVADVWVAMANELVGPLMEAMQDPKRFASQLGLSENGAESASTSDASGLPSVT